MDSPPPKVVMLAGPNGAGKTANPYDDSQMARLDANKRVIEQAMQEAANEAVVMHQRLGLPMVEWQDGKIVLVPADQLVADEFKSTH